MRICIFGAGAVGSHLAVRLARAGHEVSCVMRGAHLEAVRANGLKLRVGDSEVSAKVNASGDPAQLGPQDVVISTLKATALTGLVSSLKPLLQDNTAIVFAQNGIPWWYPDRPAAAAPDPAGHFLPRPGRTPARLHSERADRRRRSLLLQRGDRARRGAEPDAGPQPPADRRM
ncbi:ketopantoate reductase [Bradyrhizobium sp. GM5.1]